MKICCFPMSKKFFIYTLFSFIGHCIFRKVSSISPTLLYVTNTRTDYITPETGIVSGVMGCVMYGGHTRTDYITPAPGLYQGSWAV